ncbi:MAG: glycosyltransferase family 4 protein [Myxococcota bacterium]
MYLTPNSGFLRRVANYLLFALTAVLASPRAGRPDVVVATSPQFFVGVAGAIVAKTKRRPFVLEIRDLWPKSIVELGQLGPGPILSALEALERWLYRSAAGIVVNTRTFVDHIAERGVDRDRIELVYNGIDPERFAPRPRNEALLAEHDLTDRFTVAYVGTLGPAHGLTLLVDVAERMRSQPRLRFVLIGDGADREKLEADIARRGLDNVVMLGLQPRDAMPDWIASIDLLLVMLRDLPVFETVIPSKIFEFLAQERPVVLPGRGRDPAHDGRGGRRPRDRSGGRGSAGRGDRGGDGAARCGGRTGPRGPAMGRDGLHPRRPRATHGALPRADRGERGTWLRIGSCRTLSAQERRRSVARLRLSLARPRRTRGSSGAASCS